MSIVVSGLGLVTPLGISREKTWCRLLDGQTAIQNSPQGLMAQVINFSINGARSRTGELALMAAHEALQQSNLPDSEIFDQPIGCCVSQSKPILLEDGSPLNAELLFSTFTGWSPEALIRKKFHLTGPSGNVIAACATGIASIEMGMSWIENGFCDRVLVGAAESSLNSFYRAGFEQMGVLVHGASATAACPFSLNRNGFVMGEGAAVMLLEREELARKRSHSPLAKILSVKLQQSLSDSIRFDPEGHSISRLIKDVTSTHRPDYINAHGTGTKFNDEVETKGIRKAFGEKASSIPVSSTKAATGHLLGAAGAVEAAFCVLALRDQIIPPTLHYADKDPLCDLDYVPHHSRPASLVTTLSLSYGFGGQMGGVLFGGTQ